MFLKFHGQRRALQPVMNNTSVAYIEGGGKLSLIPALPVSFKTGSKRGIKKGVLKKHIPVYAPDVHCTLNLIKGEWTRLLCRL